MILSLSLQIELQQLFSVNNQNVIMHALCNYAHNYGTYYARFYCNIDIFQMFVKGESETENGKCVINVDALILRLKNEL